MVLPCARDYINKGLHFTVYNWTLIPKHCNTNWKVYHKCTLSQAVKITVGNISQGCFPLMVINNDDSDINAWFSNRNINILVSITVEQEIFPAWNIREFEAQAICVHEDLFPTSG